MTKNFGEKMAKGDKVVVRTWSYAVSPKTVRNAACLMSAGSVGTIERVIGMNAVVVKFGNGLAAPVHPAYIYPEGR
jgi:hypothetical protein